MATTDQDRELSVDDRGKNGIKDFIRNSHDDLPLKGVVRIDRIV